MVVTVLVPVRRAFNLHPYIRSEHFDNMGKFVVLTSTIVGYSYASEYFMAWYSGSPYEQMSFWHRAFGDYWWATSFMIGCNVLVPLPLWIKKVRTNVVAFWIISIGINIGMWFERYVIIVTGLSHEYDPAAWGYYSPKPLELAILAASFGFFLMNFLIFLRMFPVIAIQEVKELHYHRNHHHAAVEGGH
jgi:molybdopterin-containing oxidoreductase family membrane subunit